MKTPIQTALEQYLQKDLSRTHMPGHKGAAFDLLAPVLPYDLTEVQGTDSLYQAEEAIAECERQYSQLYGSKGTLLSAGGSTLCIQTMLALAFLPGNELIAGRNLHVSAVNAMALLDLRPHWVYPRQNPDGIGSTLAPEDIERALVQHPNAKGVYLTSPDYFGVLSDVSTISSLCRSRNIPLLVDNAHGAHLPFLDPPCHPITQGASLCCDSLHKTMPVITGGALLHIGEEKYLPHAKQTMSMFGSTSPSYLIMLSIDRALDYIHTQCRQDLAQTARRTASLKALAQQKGFFVPGPPHLCDPTRLTLGFASVGYTGEQFGQHLRSHGIEPEYLSSVGCVLLMSSFLREQDWARVSQMLQNIHPKPSLSQGPPAPLPVAQSGITLREAIFSHSQLLPVKQCENKICACVKSPCPPGIPIVMPGERIEKNLIKTLKQYRISFLNVVK